MCVRVFFGYTNFDQRPYVPWPYAPFGLLGRFPLLPMSRENGHPNCSFAHHDSRSAGHDLAFGDCQCHLART